MDGWMDGCMQGHPPPSYLRAPPLPPGDPAPPPSQDQNGLSDPFVTIGVGNALALKEHKTTVKKKTLNPTWNENFDLMVPENQPYLVFTVFDEDLLSASPAPRRDGRHGPEGGFCLSRAQGGARTSPYGLAFCPAPLLPPQARTISWARRRTTAGQASARAGPTCSTSCPALTTWCAPTWSAASQSTPIR